MARSAELVGRLMVMVVVGGCAHAQPTPAAPEPAPPLLLPRLSIAAVLQHRGDLDLTDDQLQRLLARDDELEKQQAPLRAAKPQPTKVAQPAPDATPRQSGRHGGRQHSPPADTKPVGQTPQEQLDDNDTRAYLAAEAEVLTEKQRDPAREIASKYREDLYDQRSRAQSN